jgi:hypothetical protein
MTKTEKLVFIADYIEPGRKTPGVEEIRETSKSFSIIAEQTGPWRISPP